MWVWQAPILVLAAIALILASQKLAEIFVYVPWDSSQHSRLTVFLDGTPAAEIQPGRFFLINADSGRHVLMAGDGIPTVVVARTGQDAFVRVARQIEVGPSGKNENPVLEVLSPEQARLDMVNLAYVRPKKGFSPSVSKEDPFLHERPKLKTRSGSQ